MELPKINERHKTKFRIAKRIPAAPALFCPSSRNPLFNDVFRIYLSTRDFLRVCHRDGSADTLYHALFASPANGIKSVSAEPSLCHAHMCHHFNSQSGKAASIRLI